MTQRLILASNNAGKLKEFNELLSTIGFSVHAQGEYAVPESDEPFHTFVENALQKARHASRLTGLPLSMPSGGAIPPVRMTRGSTNTSSPAAIAPHFQRCSPPSSRADCG